MNNTALLDELAQLAAQRIGLRIPDDAHDRFIGILHERARRRGYSALEDYRDFLVSKQAAGEWEELARAFTSGETFFFRDHGQFDLMRLHLLPELIARQRSDKTLRLWSAGCASGEEAYSLAMLVDMLLPEGCGWNILILGTDINSEALAKARRGQYGKWSFRMIPPEVQQRYFHLDGNEWVLDERIRRMVTFRVSNLISEPFPDSASGLHDMDLILCRNVFIYFAAAAVSAVAAKFAAALREGGYLLTAHTELIGHPVQELESRLFAEGVVYQRRAQVPVPTSAIRRVQVREPFPSTSLRAWEERHAPPSSFDRAGQASPAGGGRSNAPSLARSAWEAPNIPHPPMPSPQSSDGTTSHSTRSPKGGDQVAGYPASGRESEREKQLLIPAGEGWGGGKFSPLIAPVQTTSPAPLPTARNDEALLKEARAHADRGEFDVAEQMCRKALVANPLAVAPYFLLAQLAQIKGDFNQAKECLNKAIYLDSRFVAAYLELATLCERAEDVPRAQALRRAALGIVRTMPNGEVIEQYETTAGDLKQWLTQWEREPTAGA